MKVILLMKNRTENSFEYNSDIQTEENGEFKKTSNIGTYSGAKGTVAARIDVTIDLVPSPTMLVADT